MEEAIQKQQAIETHSMQADEFAGSYVMLEEQPYQTCFTYSRHRLNEWLERLTPRDGHGLRALDVGCGTGHQMAWLRERGFDVAGVDGSAEMLEHARRNNPGAEIHQADVERLPFPDASFDLILSIEVLRYLPSLSGCLSEMARVLKPGGQAIVTAAPLWSLNGYPLVNRVATLVPVGDLVRLKQFFTTSRELRRQLRRAGFRAPQVHGVSCGPVNWVEHLAPSRLPEVLKKWEQFDTAVADHMLMRDFSNMFVVRAVRKP